MDAGVPVHAVAAVADVEIVRDEWNAVQSAFLQADPEHWPYVDLEGAVRAGKTTPLVAKILSYCLQYPGIQCALCRWTQDALDAQLKPRWRDWCHKHGIELQWHADEEFDEVTVRDPATGEVLGYSRVYLRALKASEETARFGKLAGLTLAVIGIDQPEEVPKDVYEAYIPARLSQPGMPHQVLLTPNPPGLTHWIAELFPENNSKPGYLYLRTSVYDNRHNVGDAYIDALEVAYPEGHALRRRFIEGKRGLSIVGKPVYGATFKSRLHVVRLAINAQVPLLEGYDFGHKHPAVVWAQILPWGELRVLGGILGFDQFIEDFMPIVIQQRAQWFGTPALTDDPRGRWAKGDLILPFDVQSTGDPAGDQNNSQGTRLSAADVLREHGVNLYTIAGANHPDARDRCLQVIAGYQKRLTRQGPAFAIDPVRWLAVMPDGTLQGSTHMVDAFEAGYVWDERAIAHSVSPNTRRARKDGYYDHSMNALEYVVLAYGPAQPTKVDHDKAEARARRQATDDYDEADQRRAGNGVTARRGRFGGVQRGRRAR